ncbi:hypothetical protein F2Q69_00052483 [Brassica cretica]|uniref:Uncharacterized protein n=2 Tax=Brassica cretica TaxID=69181 RepID=A0ABQ7EM63_BRACR|nr:hypothetical protein F2Q69_00052483 [Brassica cretica]KAF3598084.1 hypothetical protein DY000_02020987 [Brassica cretica]
MAIKNSGRRGIENNSRGGQDDCSVHVFQFMYIGFVKDFFTKVHDDPFGPLSPHFASDCPGQSSLRCSMPNLPVIKTRAKPSLQWNDSDILSRPPKSNFTSCSWHMYSDVHIWE